MVNDKESLSNLRIEGSKTDKRKQSLYFPESMLQEIKEEAARLDRSLSWVVQRAWKISRLEIKKLPSVRCAALEQTAPGSLPLASSLFVGRRSEVQARPSPGTLLRS